MTEKRFKADKYYFEIWDNDDFLLSFDQTVDLLNQLNEENEQLKEELKRCRAWLNSDKYDYELTLAFIKNKGYSLKDVLEYEKEMGWE